MALTRLDDNCALIVIDLQKGVVGMPTVHPTNEIIDRVAQLASAFRERGSAGRSGQRDRAGSGPDRRRTAQVRRFRPIGPSWFLNWSSSPAITW